MPSTTFNFTQAKLDKFIAMTKWRFPMPLIENPAYVDEKTTPNIPASIPEFTDNQWAREAWIRYWKVQEKRYREQLAKDAIDISIDKDLVT